MTAAPPAVVRDAAEADVAAILAIYNDAVANTVATYDLDPVSYESRLDWFTEHRELGQAVLVAEVDGRVVGFGAWGTFRPKAGYAKTMEHSLYVDAAARGLGVGRLLMQALIDTARAAGGHVLIGALDADNRASVNLHEGFGFVEVGRLPQVGAKFGRWLDLAFYQLLLDDAPAPAHDALSRPVVRGAERPGN